MGEFVLVVLLLAIYFLPSINAAQRNHRNAGAIFILNLLLGWTVLGWVAALVWSSTADTEEQPSAEGRIKIQKDQPEDVFRPDGMAGNTPYRVLPNGEAEALIQGGIVRFQNLEQLQSALGTATPIETKTAPISSEVGQIAPNVDKLVSKPDAWQRPSPTENAPMTFKQKMGMWVFFGALLIGLFILFAMGTH